jgi:hypothetical protein
MGQTSGEETAGLAKVLPSRCGAIGGVVHCGDCGHNEMIGFNRKRRAFCPFCGARRMAQATARLVDHVVPHVPVRSGCWRCRPLCACCWQHSPSW